MLSTMKRIEKPVLNISDDDMPVIELGDSENEDGNDEVEMIEGIDIKRSCRKRKMSKQKTCPRRKALLALKSQIEAPNLEKIINKIMKRKLRRLLSCAKKPLLTVDLTTEEETSLKRDHEENLDSDKQKADFMLIDLTTDSCSSFDKEALEDEDRMDIGQNYVTEILLSDDEQAGPSAENLLQRPSTSATNEQSGPSAEDLLQRPSTSATNLNVEMHERVANRTDDQFVLDETVAALGSVSIAPTDLRNLSQQQHVTPQDEMAGTSGAQNAPYRPSPAVKQVGEECALTENDKTKPKDRQELCKLFVGELNERTTDDSLREYFKKWGDVIDAFVKKDPETSRSKGFGFVTFTREFMVDEVQKNRPHIIDGRLVCCRRSIPKKVLPYPGGFMTKLFLPSLREGIKEKDLENYFQQFGKVLYCSIVTNRTNNVHRYGFISFQDYDSVDKIILIRGHTIKGCYIEPKISLSREQLAERNLKFYLKYFGGFQNWPITAIEDWIRRHPEIWHNHSIPNFANGNAPPGMFMFRGVWMDGNSRKLTMTPPRVPITYQNHHSFQSPAPSHLSIEGASSSTCLEQSVEDKVKAELCSTDSDSEDYQRLFDVKEEFFMDNIKEESPGFSSS